MGFEKCKSIKDNKQFNKIVGYNMYSAPEVLRNIYDFKSDLWSVGVIGYLMLCGDMPF